MSFILIISAFLVLLSLSSVSAVTHNLDDTNTSAQINTAIGSSGSDTELVFKLANGNYNNLANQININRDNVTIIGESRGGVIITGSGSGTLFSITAKNVTIINLTISGYATAISSNKANLTITNNTISTSNPTIIISNTDAGAVLDEISIKNNNIISGVTSTTYGAVYINLANNAGGILDVSFEGNNITGAGASGSMGVRINAVGSSINIIFDYNNITGENRGVYLRASSSNNTNITFINNNITGKSYNGVYLDAYSNNTNITFTNNNITGNSYGVYLNASSSNNTNITFINNNITGTSSYGVDLNVSSSNNTKIIFTNNNITGTSYQGVYLNASGSNNTKIIFTNNNITGTSSSAVYLNASGSNNTNITFTNNNITGNSYGVYLPAYSSNNTNITFTNNNIIGKSYRGVDLRASSSNNTNITFINNNITGTSYTGVFLDAYSNNNATFSFVNNSIRGATGLHINSDGEDYAFSGLYLVNNTINATSTYGIFFNASTSLKDIFISGNNIFSTGTGIYIPNATSMGINNVTVNYNRILSPIGLDINAGTSINADYNWWGSNSPVIVGMTLNNWFVMELSSDTNWTIINASVKRAGSVVLTYRFLLYDNNTNTTSIVPFYNLPDFLVDIYWNQTGVGNLNSSTGVSALGTYSYNVPSGNYTLNAMGDFSDVILKVLVNKLNTNSTIVVPNNVLDGKTINIAGVATDEKGNLLTNTKITVIVDGKSYTVTTDINGRWTLAYKPTRVGTVSVSAIWGGNSTHNRFTNSTTFNVAKRNIIVKITIKENNNRSITIIANATYEDDGSPASSYPVKFLMDGKVIGTGITDKKGIAMLTIPANKITDGSHTFSVIIGEGQTANNVNASIEFTKTTPDVPGNETNKTSNYPAATAAMKNTGIPIIAILLVLLTTLGVIVKKTKINNLFEIY